MNRCETVTMAMTTVPCELPLRSAHPFRIRPGVHVAVLEHVLHLGHGEDGGAAAALGAGGGGGHARGHARGQAEARAPRPRLVVPARGQSQRRPAGTNVELKREVHRYVVVVVFTGERRYPQILKTWDESFVTVLLKHYVSQNQFVPTHSHTGQTMRSLYRNVRPV
jgi:hypothetical protein